MCSNYLPVTRQDRLLTYFGVDYEHGREAADAFPLGDAPFIRLAPDAGEDGRPALVAEDGMFGLMPPWAAELQFGRRTYNARSETVAQLPSFRDAWRRSQRCIVPVEAVYEPSYESGSAVRWRIAQDGGVPLGIAGLYTQWRTPEGQRKFSFTMITVNCDAHPFYQRFHKPGEEKRMPVFLDRADYGPWLTCPLAEAPRFFKAWGGVFVGEAAPLQRATRVLRGAPAGPVPSASPAPPPEPPQQGDLF